MFHPSDELVDEDDEADVQIMISGVTEVWMCDSRPPDHPLALALSLPSPMSTVTSIMRVLVVVVAVSVAEVSVVLWTRSTAGCGPAGIKE